MTSKAEGGWQILERLGPNNPEIVRVVRRLPESAVRARFPVLLEVRWGYRSLPNGLPIEAELIYARTLYAELGKIVGQNGIHAMTRTGDGGRTIYYYIASADPIRDSVRRFFDAQPPISVSVSARADPDWRVVKQVLNETIE
ncbi:DUF695 domain-containing protein [Niveibacterium microcysteis]|uniref:DUF695 domain-containing protein n=1 Tax=Niveibacterium microcysteis TaxID=2811415 RepID=A0ABX7M4I7_9RHOO|nr:DUF695 domain-containing protein [Niveibacterium microcysteis]QSI76650.1 DUF695 domain-containing protein [Niveibacterium microcysteis]